MKIQVAHFLLIASVAFQAVSGDFVVRFSQPVLTGFIDPIVSPDKNSGHLHVIFGSSSITEKTKTAKELKDSVCTSASIQADRSAYWFPTTHMVNPITKRIIRLHASSSVYYLFNQTNYKLDEFDMSAMSGGLKFLIDGSKSQFRNKIIMGCAKSMNARGEINHVPNFSLDPALKAATNCTFFVARFLFPSCWNGQMDSPDHFSHLAYAGNDRKCPPSHPRPIPEIHINYDIHLPFPASWQADPMYLPFFFSNGQNNAANKTVAYGLHADYFGAWDDVAFDLYARRCYWFFTPDGCGNFDFGGYQPEILRKYYDSESGRNCRAEHSLYTQADSLPQNFRIMQLDQQINKPEACFRTSIQHHQSEMCVQRKDGKVWIRTQRFSRIEPALENQYGPAGPGSHLAYNGYDRNRGLSYNAVRTNWVPTNFRSYHLNRFLELMQANSYISSSGSTNVRMEGYANTTNQHWRLELVDLARDIYRIVSVHSNKCLDVEAFNPNAGANVHQFNCHGNVNQQWKLEPVVIKGRQYHRIRTQLHVNWVGFRCLSVDASNQIKLANCDLNNVYSRQLFDTRVASATMVL